MLIKWNLDRLSLHVQAYNSCPSLGENTFMVDGGTVKSP